MSQVPECGLVVWEMEGSDFVKQYEGLRSNTVVHECCYSCHKIHSAAVSASGTLNTKNRW